MKRLLLVFLLCACSEKKAPNSESASAAAAAEADFKLLAVADAAVKIHNVKEGDSQLLQSWKVPIVTISHTAADYVQILRCSSRYKLRTLTGTDIGQAVVLPPVSELEWVWAQAVQDHHSCKFLADRAVVTEFRDLSAPSGSFYYVVNPCVSADRALGGRDGCSFRLGVSPALAYTNALKAEYLDKTEAVSKAEAQVSAVITNAMHLAQKIKIHFRACEDMIAHKNQELGFKRGMLELGLIVSIGVAATALGGPNLGVMAAQMGGQFGGLIIAQEAFKWPEVILNECKDPNIMPTTAEEREEMLSEEREKSGITGRANISQNTGRFEEMFSVQTMIRELQGMLAPGGALEEARGSLGAALAALREVETGFVVLDAIDEKSSRKGEEYQKVKPAADTLPDLRSIFGQ